MLDEGDGKVWWRSRAIWSALVTIAAGLTSLLTGHVITPDDQGFLTTQLVNGVNSAANIAGVVFGLGAWFYRWKATERISNRLI